MILGIYVYIFLLVALALLGPWLWQFVRAVAGYFWQVAPTDQSSATKTAVPRFEWPPFFFSSYGLTHPEEKPAWVFAGLRFLVTITLLALPILYDLSVAEVAGDIRWYTLHMLALGGLTLYALLQFTRHKAASFTLPVVGWLMLALTVWCGFSLVDAYNPDRGWWFFKHFVGYAGLFYLIYLLRHPRWTMLIIWALVLPVLYNAPLAVLQFLNVSDAQMQALLPFWPDGYWVNYWRALYPESAPPGATLANKNLLASWLVFVLPLSLYLLFSVKRISLQFVAGLCLTLGLVGLLFTRSRASWIGFAAAVLFLALWAILQPAWRRAFIDTLKQRPRHLLVTPLLIFVIAIGTLVSVWDIKSPRKAHSVNLSVMEQAGSVFADMQMPRISYNLNGLIMVKDHWFNGIGIAGFHTVYPAYHDAWIPTKPQGYRVDARPQRTHNDLMEAFIELGIPGGLMYLGVFGLTLWGAWQLGRQGQVVSGFLMAGTTGLCLNAMGDFPLQMPTAPIVLFTGYGLMAALAVQHNVVRVFTLPKMPQTRYIWLAGALVGAAATVYVYQDNTQRHASARTLKPAMVLMKQGQANQKALDLITQAYNMYPHNQRVQEYYGIIHKHYPDRSVLTLGEREQVMRKVLAKDPYAPNHLINLASLLHEKAQRQLQLGNRAKAEETLQEIDNLTARMMDVAAFSHYPYNIAGLTAIRRNQLEKARELYLKAHLLAPKDQAVKNTLQQLGIDTNRISK